MRVLGIMDRGYRGAVETQFFDALYGVLDLAPRIGEFTIALRGAAVTVAVAETTYRPELRLGELTMTTLPDYRRSVAELIADGVPILVDDRDLAALGFTESHLVPGASAVDADELAAAWPTYDEVWFL